MVSKQLKPGLGWRHLAGPVWEHNNGSRVHLMGVVRTPDNQHHYLNDIIRGNLGRLLVCANGGNKKRGLMAWANWLTSDLYK